MYSIYLRKELLNTLSKEEFYFLAQSLKALNMTKFFYVLAIETKNGDFTSQIQAKKYIELIFPYQASSLWEIYVAIRDDLKEKGKKILPDNLVKELEKITEEMNDTKNYEMKILKDIRNKHSFHLSVDKNYVFSQITEDTANSDIRIGFGETERECDYFYTLDYEMLFSFLSSKYNYTKENIHEEIFSIINKHSKRLIDLFNSILSGILPRNSYIINEEEIV